MILLGHTIFSVSECSQSLLKIINLSHFLFLVLSYRWCFARDSSCSDCHSIFKIEADFS